ncbi:Hypothetical protein, putative [Bodo saltans]|uniref:Uncharacterized protein n=1 Tax=Bodo saltans TaxID=75058 RepID=A0A0S4JTK9_BODSA|nr:Hypothetical protein, putative [Bodo saltans]|eukprot:CUG93564.1 Hypothetical protein, putative [Bodo saltans]
MELLLLVIIKIVNQSEKHMAQTGNPAEVVLNNLRLRLAALEAQSLRAATHLGDRSDGTGGIVVSTNGEVPPERQRFPPLNLESRLGSIQQQLTAKPSLSGPATECVKKLTFITKERKAWIQTGNPAGVDLDAMLDADSPSSSNKLGNNSHSQQQPNKHNDLAMLLHYARDEYLRDLSALRAYALSREGSDQLTQWRMLLPEVLSHITILSSSLAAKKVHAPAPSAGTSLASTAHGGAATTYSICDILEHDATFQANGQTKTLDDLAELLHSNAERVARLEARWQNLHGAFEGTVEWVNRALCEIDLSLEVAELAQ